MTNSKDDALRRIADRTVCDCEVVAKSVMPEVTGTCRTKWPGLPNEWCVHCLAQSGLEHLESTRRRQFMLMAKHMAVLVTADELVPPNYERAGGDCVCAKCGLEYVEHPRGSLEFLTLLCNGDQVKL